MNCNRNGRPYRPAASFVPALLLFVFAAAAAHAAPEVRVKDIAYIQGVRENQLVGIGIVTGLKREGGQFPFDPVRRNVEQYAYVFRY